MIESLYITFVITAGVSLAVTLAAGLGLADPLLARLRRSKLENLEGLEQDADWPLAARLARSLGLLTKSALPEDELMTRLLQSGLPYYSPAHYYSRQVTSALLFAAFGLVNAAALGLALRQPLWLVAAAALGCGLWGAAQPGAEVRARLRRRGRELALDMTYQLPRLVLLLEALGSLQEAMAGYLETAQAPGTSEKVRREAEVQARLMSDRLAMDLGIALNGMGGNLFAELLNRIASQLARSVRPEDVAAQMRQLYPPSLELDNFLDILSAGLSGGLPMKERLAELAQQLRLDLRARQREAAQAANQVVIIAAAAELLPIFAVVSAPVLYLAFQLFL
jgi:hypothetical protein